MEGGNRAESCPDLNRNFSNMKKLKNRVDNSMNFGNFARFFGFALLVRKRR